MIYHDDPLIRDKVRRINVYKSWAVMIGILLLRQWEREPKPAECAWVDMWRRKDAR